MEPHELWCSVCLALNMFLLDFLFFFISINSLWIVARSQNAVLFLFYETVNDELKSELRLYFISPRLGMQCKIV